MSFRSFRHKKPTATISRPEEREKDRVPNGFCEYMECTNNRFTEICKLYLKELSIDDVKFLEPEDLINIVPPDQYEHKLLMTIMVRRYLFRRCECPCEVSETMSDDVPCENRSRRKKKSRKKRNKSMDVTHIIDKYHLMNM